MNLRDGRDVTNKTVGLTDAKIRGLIPSTTSRNECPIISSQAFVFASVKSGIKTFILRKRVGEQWKNITIGPFKEYFGLADARKKARSILLDIENGKGAPKPAKGGRDHPHRAAHVHVPVEPVS